MKRSGSGFRNLTALVFAISLLTALPAHAAAECPATEKVEGGDYCSFIAKDDDVVHVWKSPNYDPSGALVIYIHGDTSKTDATWASDKLAEQFRLSGVNGLFIVPRGPTCGKCADKTVRWETLDDLLKAVKSKIDRDLPAGLTVIIGHSNAIRTTNQEGWINDPRVSRVIALDTLYTDPKRYQNWLKSSEQHRMVLVGENTEEKSIEVAKAVEDNVIKLDVPSGPKRQKLPDEFPPLTDDEKARQAIYLHSPVGHHYMPENLIAPLLPLVVQGAGPTPSGAPAAPPPVAPKIEIISPRLEVLIPGVDFSSAVLRDGSITIPFIAQYIGGVYRFLLGIVGIVAAVMMMVGGFHYLTAGGDANRVKAGRKRITDALIGLVLAFGSYLLLYTINPNLVNFESLKLAQVETIVFIPTEGTDRDLDAAATAQQRSGVVPYTAYLGRKGKGCCSTNGVPLYKQNWYYDVPYLNSNQPTCSADSKGKAYTIATSGCGITSAAMVLSYHLKKEITPPEMARLATDNGYRTCDAACGDCNGTGYGFFTDEKTMGKYGMKGEDLDANNPDLIMKHLRENQPIIVSVGKSIFTQNGHFIVLTGIDAQGNILVNDPNKSPENYGIDITEAAIPPKYIFGEKNAEGAYIGNKIKSARWVHPK